MRYIYSGNCPLGVLHISESGGAIDGLYFQGQTLPEGIFEETSAIRLAFEELFEYFRCERKAFGVKLAPKGTNFQMAVWKALTDIPYGETRSYKEIACAVGNPKACRAVGMANHRNPISIFIPCHRVIGADGGLTGYGGGMNIKQILLDIEKRGSSGK